jgi:hypothetical protein
MNTDNKNEIRLSGLLTVRDYGDSEEVLFLGEDEQPLAEYLEYKITYKKVSCRYWITDKEVTRDQAQNQFLKTLFGNAKAEFHARYSEMTGYLWTDEELKIGGHNLMNELKSHAGSWLILEIDIHNE